nr:MAG: nonstructural protein [Army ant associated chapparvovirus 3]
MATRSDRDCAIPNGSVNVQVEVTAASASSVSSSLEDGEGDGGVHEDSTPMEWKFKLTPEKQWKDFKVVARSDMWILEGNEWVYNMECNPNEMHLKMHDQSGDSSYHLTAHDKGIEVEMQHELFIENVQEMIEQQKGIPWFTSIMGSTNHGAMMPELELELLIKIWREATHVKNWIIVVEKSGQGKIHYHILFSVRKRIDVVDKQLRALTEKIGNGWWKKMTQKVRNFPAFLKYLLKEPLHFYNHECNGVMTILECMWVTPTLLNRDTTKVNPVVNKILTIMQTHNVRTLEEIMRVEPKFTQTLLHRTDLDKIIKHCHSFLQNTQNNNVPNTVNTWQGVTPDLPDSIYNFLIYQGIDVDHFHDAIWQLLFMKHSKKNIMCVEGPSNTGKTSFFRGLRDLFTIGEFQAEGQFSFANGVGKALVMWEEPLIGQDIAEKCKQIFGGEMCRVPKKYSEPQDLLRTPIIMTTNRPPWYFCSSNEDAFRNRMFYFKFTKTVDRFAKEETKDGRCGVASSGGGGGGGLSYEHIRAESHRSRKNDNASESSAGEWPENASFMAACSALDATINPRRDNGRGEYRPNTDCISDGSDSGEGPSRYFYERSQGSFRGDIRDGDSTGRAGGATIETKQCSDGAGPSGGFKSSAKHDVRQHAEHRSGSSGSERTSSRTGQQSHCADARSGSRKRSGDSVGEHTGSKRKATRRFAIDDGYDAEFSSSGDDTPAFDSECSGDGRLSETMGCESPIAKKSKSSNVNYDLTIPTALHWQQYLLYLKKYNEDD